MPPECLSNLTQQAEGQKFTGALVHLVRYFIAFLGDDPSSMSQQVAWAAGKPGDEDELLSAQADTEGFHGHLAAARDFVRRAVDSAVRADSKETGALWQANGALREAEFGNTTEARREAAAALALAPGRDVRMLVALALARADDSARSKSLLDELEKTSKP